MTLIEHHIEIDSPNVKVHDYLVELKNFVAAFPDDTVLHKNYEGKAKPGDTFELAVVVRHIWTLLGWP